MCCIHSVALSRGLELGVPNTEAFICNKDRYIGYCGSRVFDRQ
jgi:hypothetical protein